VAYSKLIRRLAVPVLAAGLRAAPASAVEAVPPSALPDREVEIVVLKASSPEAVKETLAGVGARWGLFAGMDILPVTGPAPGSGALLVRGREEQVDLAVRLARGLDGLLPPAAVSSRLVPVPLEHVGPAAMKEMLLLLWERAGLPADGPRLVIFPGESRGNLFFLGSAEEAARIASLARALDEPRFAGVADNFRGFWREFRSDLERHFIALSTYLAAALALLGLHLLLTVVPGLGPIYRRWFDLVWTRLLDGIKGRDFVYEVLRRLAETAVAAARNEPFPPPSGSAGDGGDLRRRALANCRELMRLRGLDPNRSDLRGLAEQFVDAALSGKAPGGEKA